MQFYMIHKDPSTSAKLMPKQALSTNIREGYQMLSDIGHIHGVVWEGQNKLYSRSHAKTLSFCTSIEAMEEFTSHYLECLFEYRRRTGKKSSYYQKYVDFIHGGSLVKIMYALSKDKYEQTRRYLLEAKHEKLTDEEIERLGCLP